MPVKFDDISKTANEVLSDDYQTKGTCFKAKQKTSFDGAVVTTTVDVVGDKICTPSKMTWKLPTPFGCPAFAIDKLEMDKSGGYKLECSSDKVGIPKLKVEGKSDLVNFAKSKVGATYTGVKDAQFKFEATACNPEDCVAEATYQTGDITLGTKFELKKLVEMSPPDLGMRYASGPLFASLYAKKGLSVFTAHGFYKATPELKCAATFEQNTQKGNSNFSLGIGYAMQKGTLIKAKVQDGEYVHCTVKHDISKGFTALAGLTCSMSGVKNYGFQLSIE